MSLFISRMERTLLESLNKIYKVGLYIRLSREDDDKTLESESITNQKSLLLQYVKENHLKVYDIYIDDGYSGTNFDRPDFNRLLNDIESGRINMVITKDMSRLGRDYIGTGNLIEKYFPEHNVRYIAVTDNIDTFLDSSNNDIAPFKAIMNDMYAKDISKKIKSSLKAKMKEGKWVGGRTPFGYDQDKDDKNHLVINDEQAETVKLIFYFQDIESFYRKSDFSGSIQKNMYIAYLKYKLEDNTIAAIISQFENFLQKYMKENPKDQSASRFLIMPSFKDALDTEFKIQRS